MESSGINPRAKVSERVSKHAETRSSHDYRRSMAAVHHCSSTEDPRQIEAGMRFQF